LIEKSSRAELDSHADTCGINNTARILEYTNQAAEVSGLANSMEPIQNIPIVKAALAYDHPETGEVIVLIINQALYFGEQLYQILLNPNQSHAYGNIVDDVPRQFGGASHASKIPDKNLSIPLNPRGIISHPYSDFFNQTEENKEQVQFAIKAVNQEHHETADDIIVKVYNSRTFDELRTSN
jgi:hypothetical protein